MPREEWTLDYYDPFEIHARGSDERGHYYRPRPRFPDHWAGLIEEVVSSPEVPEYRTASDFIRDAVWHRLEFWRQNSRDLSPKLEAALRREHAIVKMNRVQSAIGEFERFVTQLDEIAATLERNGDWRGLNNTLNELEDDAREAFQEPYLERILERVQYWRKRGSRY